MKKIKKKLLIALLAALVGVGTAAEFVKDDHKTEQALTVEINSDPGGGAGN
jgi:hypothetical protein